jgi:hypothetical protein
MVVIRKLYLILFVWLPFRLEVRNRPLQFSPVHPDVFEVFKMRGHLFYIKKLRDNPKGNISMKLKQYMTLFVTLYRMVDLLEINIENCAM